MEYETSYRVATEKKKEREKNIYIYIYLTKYAYL